MLASQLPSPYRLNRNCSARPFEILAMQKPPPDERCELSGCLEGFLVCTSCVSSPQCLLQHSGSCTLTLEPVPLRSALQPFPNEQCSLASPLMPTQLLPTYRRLNARCSCRFQPEPPPCHCGDEARLNDCRIGMQFRNPLVRCVTTPSELELAGRIAHCNNAASISPAAPQSLQLRCKHSLGHVASSSNMATPNCLKPCSLIVAYDATTSMPPSLGHCLQSDCCSELAPLMLQ
mmetsp:Transcript_28745/g.66748  ORF Transcript_28745/g.66748 Transcript_28745/m.66748 type:complete len:233 (+) Transcript_28745:3263-3961(+)